MIVVDASAIVSALWPQDVNHQVSRIWLDQHLMTVGYMVAPLLIRSEIAGAIARRAGDPMLGHQAVQRLMAFPRLYLVPVIGDIDELATQLAADLRLRGADAAYVVIAAYYNLPLNSWDREQRERASRRIVARRPGDA